MLIRETNLGSKLSAASDVLLMQPLSVFGMGRLDSGLFSEGWVIFTSALSASDSFRAVGCLSATGGSRLSGRLVIVIELKMGSSLFDSWLLPWWQMASLTPAGQFESMNPACMLPEMLILVLG